jgi:putative transposase
MGRALRITAGNLIYHVLNRANGRAPLFEQDGDYRAFEQVLGEACARTQMRLLAYCVMSNHWHVVVWPRADGDLSKFGQWLVLTHTQRWHAHRQSVGQGHVYQGRFKSFPVQTDDHLLTVCRYVERNPVRAKLVGQAQDWRWSSLWRRIYGDAGAQPRLAMGPIAYPPDWLLHVNQPQPPSEVDALRQCIAKDRPWGSHTWRDTLTARRCQTPFVQGV